jgi:excisionase family DNA binding protein
MPTTPGSRSTAAPSRPSTPATVAPQATTTVVNVSQLLTVAEVAVQLRVETRTVRRWIVDQQLPGYRVGRSYRVHPSHLAKFLASSRVG